MSNVVIGGVTLTDWATPNKINAGGKQQIAVHKLIGGQRVVDAIGPDPSDITFSGRFRGAGAIGQAQALDAMRIAGAQVSLAWLGLFYTVVISDFHFETEKAYEVPYTITCVVVDDPTAGGFGAIASTLDAMVGGDLTTALGLPSLPAIGATLLAPLSTAIGAAGVLQGAAQSILNPVIAAANTAASSLYSAVSAADPALNVASPDGSDPTILASWLTNAASGMNGQAALLNAAGYAGRLALNIANGPV